MNKTTSEKIPHCGLNIDHDYGCNTAIPYGAITFGQYIAAIKIINHSKNKNIFIITDDIKWVKKESKSYKKEYHIHIFPTPSQHRLPNNYNGANVFASFQVAQQCSGFVAHLGSAFSELILKYMCFHHRKNGKSIFGQCPDVFDFSKLSK
jgi:hypothetical protein